MQRQRDYSYLIGNTHAVGTGPNASSFSKGHRPWNKDKKGIHLSPGTEFKKGQPSRNKLPDGTITVRQDQNGRQRQWIKSDGQWQEYALWLWKQRYKQLLPGDVVHHLNGDSMDDRFSNLIGMPRTHHPMFHSKWGLKEIPTEQLAVYRQRYLSVMELEAK